MIRIMLVLAMLAATAGAVVAYGDPDQIARASNSVSKMLRQRSLEPAPAVQIARGKAGEFALHAKINGVKAPMVIDTGATSVVLTWETAKIRSTQSATGILYVDFFTVVVGEVLAKYLLLATRVPV